MLDVTRLSTWIGPARILHDIDLTLAQGEIACLLGPNGAGKSTLMNTLAGLLRHRQGSVTLAGKSLDKQDAALRVKSGIALSPEGRQVFTPLTVQENLLMGAYGRYDKAAIRQDFEQVLDMFPRLRERLLQVAGTLSGGEQQMLAIGRALMSRPTLLLLDEPSLGLAPKIVAEIFATISRLKERGVSILIAEQNAHLAVSTSSRTYLMTGGRIIKSGSSQDMLNDPAIRAAYLGEAGPH